MLKAVQQKAVYEVQGSCMEFGSALIPAIISGKTQLNQLSGMFKDLNTSIHMNITNTKYIQDKCPRCHGLIRGFRGDGDGRIMR